MKDAVRWRGGDRASWRGRPCTVEYVAEDALLISHESAFVKGELFFRIVAHGDVGFMFDARPPS